MPDSKMESPKSQGTSSPGTTIANLLMQLAGMGIGGVAGSRGAKALLNNFGKTHTGVLWGKGKPIPMQKLNVPGLGPLPEGPLRALGGLVGGGAGLAASQPMLLDKNASDVQVFAKAAAYVQKQANSQAIAQFVRQLAGNTTGKKQLMDFVGRLSRGGWGVGLPKVPVSGPKPRMSYKSIDSMMQGGYKFTPPTPQSLEALLPTMQGMSASDASRQLMGAGFQMRVPKVPVGGKVPAAPKTFDELMQSGSMQFPNIGQFTKATKKPVGKRMS